MSKYNLTDLLESMSDKEYASAKEADKLEKHPEKDMIKKIQALMAKEKSLGEDGLKEDDKDIQSLVCPECDGSGCEHCNYTGGHIKEVSSQVGSRIEGLLSRELKRKFLFAFEDLWSNLIEDDEFFAEDVVEHLAIEMIKHLNTIQAQGDGINALEEDAEEDAKNDADSYDHDYPHQDESISESSVDENEFDFFTTILDGRYSEDQIESYLKSEDYKMALDEFQLEDSFASDWIQEFANYYGDGADAYLDESDTKLKEHFNRFK